ncbi:MAG: hypothetical protein C4576_09255 [Desulfobacteraceae bacterium]|nr:MAG: hypothetical protein C4576_09255 [Desulfobacteraceae bacterium]
MIMKDDFLDRVLKQAPSSETLFLLLANRKAEGRLKEVIRECIEALGRYPEDARLRGLLAESCYEDGWLSRAESEIETATAKIEELVHLYKLKGLIYSALNKKEDAVKSLELYLAHKPDDNEAVSLLESMKPAGESPFKYAPEVDTRTQETAPFSVPEIATPTLAEVYFAQGQIEEAIATYQKVVDRNPDAERSRNRLEELKAMNSALDQEQEVGGEEEPLRSKKEKLIRVLETWREAIEVSSKQ